MVERSTAALRVTGSIPALNNYLLRQFESSFMFNFVFLEKNGCYYLIVPGVAVCVCEFKSL